MKASEPYFTVARDWLDHPAFAGRNPPFCRRLAWIWLLENARYQDGFATFMGQTVPVKRGDVCHATRFLARAWGWNEMAVRRYLILLKSHSLITCNTVAGQTVISICNYNGIMGYLQNSDAEMSLECVEIDAKKESRKQGKQEEHSSSARQPARRRASLPSVQPDLLQPTADVVSLSERDVDRVMVRWNAMVKGLPSGATIPIVNSRSAGREREVRKAVSALGGMEGIDALLAKIAASKYLTGQVKDFRATFDWVFKEANRVKIMEGNYDDEPPGAHKQAPKGREDRGAFLKNRVPGDFYNRMFGNNSSHQPAEPFDGQTIDSDAMEIAL